MHYIVNWKLNFYFMCDQVYINLLFMINNMLYMLFFKQKTNIKSSNNFLMKFVLIRCPLSFGNDPASVLHGFLGLMLSCP